MLKSSPQREVLELLRQQLVVPAGDLGQPVIGDHESAGLLESEMIEAQRWHLENAKLDGGKQSAVAGYDIAEAVNQDSVR